MATGKVWLVGAGPGDRGLFTLKGKQVLEEADVVVYDSLVGDGVLAMVPETAEKINVGKRASHHTMVQEDINRVLLSEAQKGKKVVRLKGGDPFLFGRGGEELELLCEYGIPYEIIPGIPSAISVPAYNGIPVTHRDYTSSLHIITGHKRAGESYNIDFKALVQTKGTLVFLMGVTALRDILGGLLEAGIDPDMPAAILQKGTTAGQKRIVATVTTLPEEVDRQGIETPAIIVVGRVCALADDFGWYEKLPLMGCKVLVTRPRGQGSVISEKLRRKGAEVLEIPAVATVPIPENLKFIYAIQHLSEYQWILFTSPAGVKIFFDQMAASEVDVRRMAHVKIGAIGNGTAKELKARGFYPDVMPSVYDGEHLGEAVAAAAKEGDHILLPRARIGNPEIVAKLAAFKVDDVPTYETVYQKQELINETRQFENGEITFAVFTSSSIVRAFVEANPDLDYTKVCAACIGRQTQAAANAFGMQTACADKATMDSLVDLVIRMYEEKKQAAKPAEE